MDDSIAQYISGKINNFRNLISQAASAIGKKIQQDPILNPVTRYIGGTAESALEGLQSAIKLSPPYIAYRSLTGNPVSPQEYLGNLVNSVGNALNVSYRMSPVAPILGAGFGAAQAISSGERNPANVVNAAIEGINTQPFIGEVLSPKNPALAQKINIASMPLMLMAGGIRNIREIGEEEPSNIFRSLVKSAKEEPTTPPPSPTKGVSALRAQKTTPLSNFEQEMEDFTQNFVKNTLQRNKAASKIPATPPISEAQKTADIAEIMKEGGGGEGIKGLPPDLVNAYQKWVNARRAADIEGKAKAIEFSPLDEGGIETFFKVQAGKKGGLFTRLRQYLDDVHQQIKNAGIPIGYRENYLPQLWEESLDKVREAFGRMFTLRPSFSLERIIKDYKTGMKLGLTPKFKKISELIGWLESYKTKALADKEFFDFLAREGYIIPSSESPSGWVTLDPDRFPKYLTRTPEGQYMGTYKASPPVAELINNYLRNPEGILAAGAKISSATKRMVMSTGIPKTGISPHGFNIMARSFLAGSESRIPLAVADTHLRAHETTEHPV